MLFTQMEFVAFFIIFYAVLFLLKNFKAQKIFILLASYFFFAYWHFGTLGLIIFSSVLDFYIGKRISLHSKAWRRRVLLLTSICINLSILGLFKYYNFFIPSLKFVLTPLNINLATLNLIVPLGISFYTFQTISYVVDVYNKKHEPCDSLLDYCLYIAFFPKLIAGPITRASEFLPQIKTRINFSQDNFYLGMKIFITGLFKKVFIADRIAFFVDAVFDSPGRYDGITVWLAALSYTIQIYCDFAGYSDMAIGAAKIMGIDLKENFNFPYCATSITEFWRRWHITLSNWIRDYVYIPLGGSKKGPVRTYSNLLVAMFLCGLWHGANWTFVCWGVLHGAALAINRLWGHNFDSTYVKNNYASIPSAISWLLTMFTVVFGWVFFRSDSLGEALEAVNKLLWPSAGIAWYNVSAVIVLCSVFFCYGLYASKFRRIVTLPLDAWYTPFFIVAMVWLVIIFYPKNTSPFIYAQF